MQTTFIILYYSYFAQFFDATCYKLSLTCNNRVIEIFQRGKSMKKKLIGIFVCTLLITTILPITGTVLASDNNRDVVPLTTPFTKYFYFGIMQLIDPEVYNFDFVVISFATIIGNGETINLKEGEMLRLHDPMFGIIINNFHIGIISDWSLIG